MLETLKLIFTKFNEETILVSSLSLITCIILFIIIWIFNRKKYHQLSHQIPASIVKNYLDTIIQNSTSLKSQLFRGGGLDLGPGISSVVPISNLSSTVSNETLIQKSAEISALQSQLFEKGQIVKDLEKRLSDLSSSGGGASEIAPLNRKIATLESEIERLEKELAAAKEAAKNSGADSGQIAELSRERDELKTRLQEYEIIEDDLANLKKLQVENVELKKQIEELKGGGSKPVASAPPPPPPPQAQAKVAETPGVPTQIVGEEKSAEDLLSEFEKMLG